VDAAAFLPSLKTSGFEVLRNKPAGNSTQHPGEGAHLAVAKSLLCKHRKFLKTALDDTR
jgi:hypothetical protein